jgi:hypothetical protein
MAFPAWQEGRAGEMLRGNWEGIGVPPVSPHSFPFFSTYTAHEGVIEGRWRRWRLRHGRKTEPGRC